jgi:hypothetical protein
MHAAVVALSELHEAVFADHMTRIFGVEWEARDMGRDRNPAWAITAVPETLVTEFSKRCPPHRRREEPAHRRVRRRSWAPTLERHDHEAPRPSHTLHPA